MTKRTRTTTLTNEDFADCDRILDGGTAAGFAALDDGLRLEMDDDFALSEDLLGPRVHPALDGEPLSSPSLSADFADLDDLLPRRTGADTNDRDQLPAPPMHADFEMDEDGAVSDEFGLAPTR